MNKIITTILSMLFPSSPKTVNFSGVPGDEIMQTSPRAAPTVPPRFPDRCGAVLAYKYPRTRALVWQIKYKRDAHALRCGGFVLATELRKKYPNERLTLIPIPISPARRRERGYNQCELLMRAIYSAHKKLSTTVLDGQVKQKMELRTDILFRSVHKKRQTMNNRRERLTSAHGIFAVRGAQPSSLKNAHLIVLDDVITTGSTLREAIKTLHDAGFTNVSGLALAH